MEPLLVVISCSSSPEDLALRDGLEKQLQGLVRQRVIRLWHAGQVRAGEATHMISISRGVFSKALGLADLTGPLWSMLISVPVILGVAVLLLKKQER